MEALNCAATHVTSGNGHFVSGHRTSSRRVEVLDNRGGESGVGDDQPVRPTVASPGQDASSSPDPVPAEQ